MTTNFPRTLAAVKKSENTQWEIGDALIAEVGKPPSPSVQDGSFKKLEACAKELLANGFDYQLITLSNLRRIAFLFPAGRRRQAYGFDLHRAAGNPEIFDTIIGSAPKNTKVTLAYIEDWKRAQELTHLRELEAEKKRRAHNAELAQREREEAQEQARKATSASERKAAQERETAAHRREQENRLPPKKKDIPRSTPGPEDTPIMIAKMRFEAELGTVLSQLKKTTENIEPFIKAGVLSPAEIDLGVEQLLTIADAARNLADLLRGTQTDKRSHLSAIKGGRG